MRSLVACLYLAALPAAGFDISYTITTAAGSDWVGDGGPATRAVLLQAEGITADFNGNIYIADAAGHRVRKLSPSGIIQTVAGTGVRGFSGDHGPAGAAQLNSPYGLAFDARGNLYIADLGNARVRRVAPDGTITTIAGGGEFPAGGDNEGSQATAVSFSAPRNLALDGDGNLYISDFTAHRVYRMSPDGSLVTAAGMGIAGFSGDGSVATRARLSYPAGLAVDRQGALYIADSDNRLIRRVVNGIISSVAHAATPTGLALDGLGTLYVADRPAGQIVRLAASGAASALNVFARDVAFAADGNLYAADGDVVRRITPSGASSVAAGGGSLAFGDNGNAKLARLNHPNGVAVDTLGNFYIADRDNHQVRRVAPDGTITTVAGTGDAGDSGDGGLATLAKLHSPSSVSVDAAGNLYVADTGNHRVRKVTPAGSILPVGGTGLVSPAYALADALGNVYIADEGNGQILKMTAAGVLTSVVTGLQSPRGLALDRAGNLYFTEAGAQRVRRLTPGGDVTSLGDGVWSNPRGVAASDTGDVFVADAGLEGILRVDASGRITPVAGDGSPGFSGDGGAAPEAELDFPCDVAIGPAGKLYIADLGNNRIRLLSPGPNPVGDPLRTLDVVNAASLEAGPLAPGMLAALRGVSLPATGSVEVLFDAIPAPVLTADSSRLLVQVPPQVGSLASVRIEVFYQGKSIAQTSAAIAEAAPALFSDSSGQALAANEDGSLNSAANPVPRGSVIVLYGTGEGVSGLPVSVRIGGYPAEVLYAGPTAGYPGLLQINARVPAGYIAPGNLSVVITVGQISSQPGITIQVN